MLTLALDTTTRAGSVAVVQDDVVVATVIGDASRSHGERLPAEIARVLADAAVELASIDVLVVASGPGAFTGLRIGLATMQGLAMVSGRPVVAVSALDALALAARTRGVPGGGDSPSTEGLSPVYTVAAWMDAQRGEVFAASYAATDDPLGKNFAAHPVVATPAAVLAATAAHEPTLFIGDGATRYREQILNSGRNCAILDTPAALAPFIARLGSTRARHGEAGPPHALQPLYVRRPDAELERQRHDATR